MKRLIPFLLVLAMAVTGCSSMLEREYSSSNRHVEYPVSDDASVLQAESYQDLVSALIYFVARHTETGVVHLSNYLGDVKADLDAACAEVLEQDPLGAYALNGIEHRYTRIVSYYEISVSFDYARTADELASIVTAGSAHAIPEILGDVMSRFDKDCVLRLNYFSGDENELLTLARQAWLDTPLAAVARPEIRVTLYSGGGSGCIAEFAFEWTEEAKVLAVRSGALKDAVQAVIQPLNAPSDGLTVEDLLDALKGRLTVSSTGGGTAYAALVEGRANKQGAVLALHLLCQQAGLETTVVEGRRGNVAHFWLIVSTPEGYRHFDPTAARPAFAADDEFAARDYKWSKDRYPECIDYAEENA